MFLDFPPNNSFRPNHQLVPASHDLENTGRDTLYSHRSTQRLSPRKNEDSTFRASKEHSYYYYRNK